MAFYLSKERSEDIVGSYRRYQEYLRENQLRFPPRAFALGTAEWWQDPGDHRCPHDAWLESISIFEPASGERSEQRTTAIRVRLLGAYHDGFIELFYPQVLRYSLKTLSSERGLGDWRYDEFRVSSSGHLIHEIEWAGFAVGETARWIIEASDVEFQWIPK